MPSLRYGLILALLIVGLSACGGEEKAPVRTAPVASFTPNPLGERVFEAYRQTGTASHSLTLPAGSRAVDIRMDCAGSEGMVKVNLSAAGGGETDCSSSKGRGGSVILESDGSLLSRKQKVTITAPDDQQWSVAIDAGSKLTAD